MTLPMHMEQPLLQCNNARLHRKCNNCRNLTTWSYHLEAQIIQPNLTFIGPCIINIFVEYNQQDAKFLNLFILVIRSTCIRWFFRPSSGAQNCTYSVRYLSDQNCLARLAAGRSSGLTNTWYCMCSFDSLMMDGKTVWNMYSVLQK